MDCPEDSSHKGKVCGACSVCSGCSVENSNYRAEHETRMKDITSEWLERVAAATTGKGDGERERWWMWHWDVLEVRDAKVPYTRIKRWRRGFFFTIYRKESIGDVAWWIYLPFNVGLGFSYPQRVAEGRDEEE